MLKIYEIKESVSDSKIIDNLYEIHKLAQNIIRQTEFLDEDINMTDFDYLNIVLEKTKKNLKKVNEILKMQ